jgi:hypothetical protein
VSDVHIYSGHLEYSSLMPNPDRWVKAKDYDALAADNADNVRRMADDANKLHAAYTRICELEAALRECISRLDETDTDGPRHTPESARAVLARSQPDAGADP